MVHFNLQPGSQRIPPALRPTSIEQMLSAMHITLSHNADDEVFGSDQGGSQGMELVVEKARSKPKKPPLYKVLLLNDDYTPMEFVVLLLMRFFSMNQAQAEQIMLHIHTKGVGVCGLFPREIAETKVRLVLEFANKNRHPLQCTMEKD